MYKTEFSRNISLMIATKRKIKPVIKSLLIGAGEMVHWLTAVVTLPEDLCSVPRTTRWFIIVHNPVPGKPMPFSDIQGHQGCTWYTYIDPGKKLIHTK